MYNYIKCIFTLCSGKQIVAKCCIYTGSQQIIEDGLSDIFVQPFSIGLQSQKLTQNRASQYNCKSEYTIEQTNTNYGSILTLSCPGQIS